MQSAKRFDIVLCVVVAAVPVCAWAEVQQASKISAPVYYEDLMLVITTDNGAAAIQFTDEIDIKDEKEICSGVGYRFRFLHKDHAKELTGVGRVYEIRDAKTNQYVEAASELYIEAGSIRMKWSLGGKGKGWIYYVPEELKVQIANSNRFESSKLVTGRERAKLDLKRFLPD